MTTKDFKGTTTHYFHGDFLNRNGQCQAEEEKGEHNIHKKKDDVHVIHEVGPQGGLAIAPS
jgi:hypothetical protein